MSSASGTSHNFLRQDNSLATPFLERHSRTNGRSEASRQRKQWIFQAMLQNRPPWTLFIGARALVWNVWLGVLCNGTVFGMKAFPKLQTRKVFLDMTLKGATSGLAAQQTRPSSNKGCLKKHEVRRRKLCDLLAMGSQCHTKPRALTGQRSSSPIPERQRPRLPALQQGSALMTLVTP